MADHERIWLQHPDDADWQGNGRLWCEDKVWPDDSDDGEPTEYVRADLYAAITAELAKTREMLDAFAAEIIDLSTYVSVQDGLRGDLRELAGRMALAAKTEEDR